MCGYFGAYAQWFKLKLQGHLKLERILMLSCGIHDMEICSGLVCTGVKNRRLPSFLLFIWRKWGWMGCFCLELDFCHSCSR
ncbi:hypothetical protein SLE2022_316140 [Rubroshorea leprosula]